MSDSEGPDRHEFQAEVRQVLDIVINSLYTDREIFLRELVSNAADALEKMRLTQLREQEVFDAQLPLEINITTDDTARTLTVSDYGIGMTREELQENLGTIAHSGSKKFLEALSAAGQKEASLIGQFGVGFYSVFMVADSVKVYTHSWRGEGEHLCWSSEGRGDYWIEEAPGQRRGCKIVIRLKPEHEEFSKRARIREVLDTYSRFVPFPLHLNGDQVSRVEALWLKSRSSITDEEYLEFYRYTAHTADEPFYRMHFSADAPLAIDALLFVPGENPERFFAGQVDPGVALYSRKVLIDTAPRQLLPDWLRFLKGVIDSADLPLNISRESMQDSALVQKLNRVITKRFLKFLEKEEETDEERYGRFYARFQRFLKEGAATDFEHREALAKLLRFESSLLDAGVQTGFAAYAGRAREGQDAIYYLLGGSRQALEAGPYLEAFRARGIEVLYFTDPVDEYVAGAIGEFQGRKLTAADRPELDLGKAETAPEGEALAPEPSEALCRWMQERCGERVARVRLGERLTGSPVAAFMEHGAMSPHLRRMMREIDTGSGREKVILELNPRHPLIHRLAEAMEADPEGADLAAQQLLDNALLSAGLIEEPQEMVQRINALIERALATGKAAREG